MKNLLAAAEIWRRNRNVLTHHRVENHQYDSTGGGTRFPPMELVPSPFVVGGTAPGTLASIRQVARDTEALWKIVGPLRGDLTMLWKFGTDTNAFAQALPDLEPLPDSPPPAPRRPARPGG